jgi:two-component system response regulator AtoC
LKILLVEDEPSLASALESSLGEAGYLVTATPSVARAQEALSHERFDLILTDLRLGDGSGLSVVQASKTFPVPPLSVVMTAFGSQETAISSIREGAVDYISKPFSVAELLFLLRKLEVREKLRTESLENNSASTMRYSFSNFIAKSESMKEVFETVKRLAPYNTTVLITGESGTGKELLAQALHYNSPRRGKPFVAINCGAIPENLIEAELFGHRKGAFTDATRDKKGLLEEANGGTVLLDEIGEMPQHLQVKLLRAIQEQQIRRVGDEQVTPIDIRVIAATLRDLEEDVRANRFREDLFYRLNVVSIHIPPLRERPDDIPLLATHFMKKHSKRLGIPVKSFSSAALTALKKCQWRGNVRELENCVERALVLSEAPEIELEALSPGALGGLPGATARAVSKSQMPDDENLSIKQRTREVEIDLIQRALTQTGGNRTRASKILEISHRALLYKLKEYGLSGEIDLGDRNDAKEVAPIESSTN